MKATALAAAGLLLAGVACAPSSENARPCAPSMDPLRPEQLPEDQPLLNRTAAKGAPDETEANPCANLECGAPCQACIPGDTDCDPIIEPRTCNSHGECTAEPPSCQAAEDA